MKTNKINFTQRLKAMMVDFSSMIVVGFVLMIISIIFENTIAIPSNYLNTFLVGTIYGIFFCKDICQGRSIGKRIFHLQVVSQDDTSCSVLKLVLRNLFVFIWPIEIIVCMINPEKRLADFLLRTKVIAYEENKQVYKTRLVNVIITPFIVLLLMYILLYFTCQFMENILGSLF